MRIRSYAVVLLIFAILVISVVLSLLRRCAPPTAQRNAAGSAMMAAEAPQSGGLVETNQTPVTPTAPAQGSAATLAPTATPPPTRAPAGIEGLHLRLSRPLLFDAGQVQGLAADERFLYIAAVDPGKQAAYLYQVRKDLLVMSQVRVMQQGNKWLLGGLALGNGLLWAPLSDGNPQGSTAILGIDPQYLEVRRSFEVPGKIVAVTEGADGTLYGVNDDASVFFAWAPDGRELKRVSGAMEYPYHDVELLNGSLVFTGSDEGSAVIDVIDPTSFTLLVRHRAEAYSLNGNWVVSKGFAFAGGEFYFLPDGGKGMVMTYELDSARLGDYIPRVSP